MSKEQPSNNKQEGPLNFFKTVGNALDNSFISK